MHLGRGEPDAVVLGHRLQHVGDQPLRVHRGERLRRHRVGHAAQDRMTEARDLEDRHAVSLADRTGGDKEAARRDTLVRSGV